MDNYFQDCPPVMSDGRLFTDYKSSTRRDEYVKYINDVTRDDDYRMLLQCNATKFMDKEWEHYTKKNKCWKNTCIHNYPTRTLPQYFPQQMQAFNDSMDPKKPKLQNTCPKFSDYRLHTADQGLTCGDSVKATSTKNIQPHELIGNHTVTHQSQLAAIGPVTGVENSIKYTNLNAKDLTVSDVSRMATQLKAPAPNAIVKQLYDPITVMDSDDSNTSEYTNSDSYEQ